MVWKATVTQIVVLCRHLPGVGENCRHKDLPFSRRHLSPGSLDYESGLIKGSDTTFGTVTWKVIISKLAFSFYPNISAK
jgi:hypothetical protein